MTLAFVVPIKTFLLFLFIFFLVRIHIPQHHRRRLTGLYPLVIGINLLDEFFEIDDDRSVAFGEMLFQFSEVNGQWVSAR